MDLHALFVRFPAWLHPEIIPGLPVRWYGLGYIAAFFITWLIYRREVKRRRFPMTEDDVSGVFFFGILCLILGARIFSTIVYEPSDLYRTHPWLVFWPFRNGRFTGLQGMSYHGGVIGFFVGVIGYCAVRKFDWREVIDMLGCGIPLGYTCGRLGNFANAELYGRITNSPLGMIFPSAGIRPTFPQYEEIASWAEAQGFNLAEFTQNGILNLPRHPSQLYEAFFEGIALWLIIWLIKDRKPFRGFIIGLYVGGYGLFRFFIEYFREPDADLGYRLQFAPNNLPLEVAHPLTSISTGQILCFLQVAAALVWLIIAWKLPNNKPWSADDAEALAARQAEAEKPAKRKRRRRR
jgi:phosphatidylglycerol:prolipoprotein diacylglycerol transferase